MGADRIKSKVAHIYHRENQYGEYLEVLVRVNGPLIYGGYYQLDEMGEAEKARDELLSQRGKVMAIICKCGEDDPKNFYPDKKPGTKKRCITCTLTSSKDPDNKRFGVVREINDLEHKYWPTISQI